MESLLIAVKASAQHGKDTVVKILVEEFGFTRVAFADPVKEAAEALDPFVRVERDLFESQTNLVWEGIWLAGTYCFIRLKDLLVCVGGWDNAKQHPDVRRLLQRMGTEVGRDVIGPQLGHGDEMWIDIADNKTSKLEKAAISDLRFPNEGVRVKKRGGFIWSVFRPGFDNGLGVDHPSEKHVQSIPHDYQLVNYGNEGNYKEILRPQIQIGLNRLIDRICDC